MNRKKEREKLPKDVWIAMILATAAILVVVVLFTNAPSHWSVLQQSSSAKTENTRN